jgi:hypothetical protein
MTDEIPCELFVKLDKAGFTRRSTYSMPKLDEALKWLRDEKKLYIMPNDALGKDSNTPTEVSVKWDFQIDDITTTNIIYESRLIYSSYEEAIIAGIEYVLDNLI